MDCSSPGFPVLHHLLELLKLISTELVMSSNHLVLCHPLLLLPSIFLSIRVFSNKLALCISSPNIGASASASVLLMNIWDWFPLGWTGLISLQSKGLSTVFFSTVFQKHQFSGAQPLSSFSSHIHDNWKNHSYDYTDLCSKVMSLLFNMLSRLIIAFLPRSKRLLIWWLQSPSTVTLELKKIKSVTVSIVSPSICCEVMGPDAINFHFLNAEF